MFLASAFVPVVLDVLDLSRYSRRVMFGDCLVSFLLLFAGSGCIWAMMNCCALLTPRSFFTPDLILSVVASFVWCFSSYFLLFALRLMFSLRYKKQN